MRILLLLLCAATGWCADVFPFSTDADLKGWQAEVGGWTIADGALLVNEPGLRRCAIWRPAMAYQDVDISVEFCAYPDGTGVRAPGIMYRARTQNEYNYIHFDHLNQQVVWVRSGQQQEWADARRHRVPLTLGEWRRARVVVRGDTHEVYLNGKLLFTEKDPNICAGAVGLRAGQGKIAFRNLSIEGTPVLMDPPFVIKPPAWVSLCTDAGAGAYEAFPDICRTPTGELLCVFYAGYAHVSVPNDALPKGARICLCRSTDNGVTWSPAEVVVDSPIDDRDPSITRLPNGELLVTYMSYDPGRRPGTHQVFTVRSADGGHTWSDPSRVPTPFTANEAVSNPAVLLSDGRLLLPCYGNMLGNTGPRYMVAVLESRDLGKTWTTLSTVSSPKEELDEPAIVELPDGSLLMVTRPTMLWCESTDGGKTWTGPQPMPTSGDAPYLLLTSKRLLLCGFRYRPGSATCLITSRDLGRTWSDRLVLDAVMGAYPSMVELPDGRIVVVYYTEGSGSDIRCLQLRADDAGVTVLDHPQP
jgi:sialidase-1